MIKTIKNQYYVEIIEEQAMAGALILSTQQKRPVCKAVLLSVPDDDEFELNAGEVVYVHRNYGHQIDDNENRMIIRSEYILAVETI